MTRRFAWLLAAALVAASLPAAAADAPAAPSPAAATPPTGGPSPAVKAEARERFDTGLHLFEKGENAGALAEFKRAYQLIPNPVVLYNMALVYAAMNRPVESVDTLAQFLADPGGAGPDQKKHAEQVRDEQTKRIAQLVVLTDHPAVVEIDGVEAGRTPLAKPIRVASGSHVVAVEAAGFLGSRREVTLAGQLTETIAMSMQPTDTRMAQLVVTAALPGAEVLVNGKRVGATPLPASVAVAPGKVKVEVQRAGYVTSAQTISLDEGARGELSFTLEEDPGAPPSVKGRLVVAASEAGAELSVDGGPRRPISGPVSLPVGPHHVRVEKLGFEPVDRNVEVVNGQDASLQVPLMATAETKAKLDANRSSRRVVGFSLVAGGLAVAIGGGVFAAISNSDLSKARTDFDTFVTKPEMMPGNFCNYPVGSGDYVAHHCDDVRNGYQDSIDQATLKRTLGVIGGAVGLVTAGIGGYLLMTNGSAEGSGAGVATARVWGDGTAAGFSFAGRF
jgi:hypothetical protein